MLLVISFPTCSWAVTVFEDDFNDNTKVDSIQTTAAVDSANSCVRLPSAGLPNAIEMNKYGDGYAVVSETGIHMYEYDDATGQIAKNNAFSIPFITDGIGVATRQDNLNMWAIRENGVQYVKFDGSSMVDDPALKMSGINQVLSVDAWENSDKAVVLSNNGGTAEINLYDASSGNIATTLTQTTSISNPVSVSIVSGTADLRVATKDTLYYLMYDDATGQYVEDVNRKITGLSGVISASTDQSTHAVTSSSNAEFIFDDDTGGGSSVAAYSIGSVSDAFAISLKPDSYDQALVTSSGEVQYWCYDDATNSMVRDSSMEITGLQLMGGFLTPKEYYSNNFVTSLSYDEVRLTVDEEVPVNTSVSYWVSSNGGLNYTAITPGTWTTIPNGDDFVLKAVLSTSDSNTTPKINYVKLKATTLKVSDLTVTAVAKNDPAQTLPTTTFPVEAKAGADVIFEVTTKGFAESVWADFTTGASVPLTNKVSLPNETNVWWGSYIVPVDAVDPSSIGIVVTAERGPKQKHITTNPFINVRGKIYEVLELSITK